MKTLLVFPRVGAIKPHSSPPLGTAQIAANMRSRNLDVRLADLTFSTWEDYIQILKRYDPDIVGVSTLSLYEEEALMVGALAHAYNQDILTVYGGVHPTINSQEMILRPEADIICVGEADNTLPEIVEALQRDRVVDTIKGIWHTLDGHPIYTGDRPLIEDLDSLPFPARDLLPMKQYLKRPPTPILPSPSAGFVFMRGCPYNCSFCQPTSKMMWGMKQRKVSPERAIREIVEVNDEYNLWSVNFHDDTFTVDKKWVSRFSHLLQKENLGLDSIINSRVNLVNDKILGELKDMGVVQIIFGVESGSNRVLDEILDKGITTDMVEKAFKLCHSHDIMARANIMLGSPTETVDEMRLTRRLLTRIKPDAVIVSITCPMEGTYLYDRAKEQGLLGEHSATTFSKGVLKGVDYEVLDKQMTSIKKEMLHMWWTDPIFLLSYNRWRAILKRTYTQFRDGNIRSAGGAMLQLATYMESKVQ